jgi:hypothetical protein
MLGAVAAALARSIFSLFALAVESAFPSLSLLCRYLLPIYSLPRCRSAPSRSLSLVPLLLLVLLLPVDDAIEAPSRSRLPLFPLRVMPLARQWLCGSLGALAY